MAKSEKEELELLVKDLVAKVKSGKMTDNDVEIFVKATELAMFGLNDIEYALKVSKLGKGFINQFIKQEAGVDFFTATEFCRANKIMIPSVQATWELMKMEAPYLFDSYLLYLEKNREPKERFYLPKRKQFNKHGLIQALQELEDDKLDILSISMPPGTQKTTLEKFFATFVIGRHPEDYSLFFSHSDDITRMFYDGVLDITTSDEYLWSEIFPSVKLRDTNAKAEKLDFGKYKPFYSLQCSSVGAKNAGKIRCNRYLYCDDLIGGIEEALNVKALEKLFRIYGTDARQRKLNEQCKEIHIATRWSVHDVIGHLQQMYEGSDRARFIEIPDIDENGNSNFDYEYNGLSVKFFEDQAKGMDEITYNALYRQITVEREGILYNDDELRRYSSLPLREPDAILGICDVKNKGTDFLFLPCLYQYDDDYYCVDCICTDSSDYELQYERMANLILNHNMQAVEFESNAGGDRVSFEVNNRVEKAGGRCNITSKATESNKETRIEVNAPWVKKHILFKQAEDYKPKEDYGVMMGWLKRYTVKGKNEHDDIPDGFANFALFVTRGSKKNVAEAIQNPFRSKYGVRY